MEANQKRSRIYYIYRSLIAALIVWLAASLLVDAPLVTAGIKRGLGVSAGVLVPSLFPFMALCGFLSASEYGAILSRPFGALTERLFKLPRELGYVVLLSMVGGYPVGAKMISSLLEQRRIDRDTASRMLCFCVNAGPSFLITAVGAGMFLDRRAGMILFGTQLAATIFVGIIVSARAKLISVPERSGAGEALVPAFVQAVTGAASSLIALCSFAVLCSGLLELVAGSGIAVALADRMQLNPALPEALLAGLFEVTTGCIAAAKVENGLGFGLASAFLSFGGVSVIFQVLSFFKDAPIRLWPFFLSRVLHMMLSTAMALPLYRTFCGSAAAWVASDPPQMLQDDKTILVSVCLLAMCSVLVLSAGQGGARQRK